MWGYYSWGRMQNICMNSDNTEIQHCVSEYVKREKEWERVRSNATRLVIKLPSFFSNAHREVIPVNFLSQLLSLPKTILVHVNFTWINKCGPLLNLVTTQESTNWIKLVIIFNMCTILCAYCSSLSMRWCHAPYLVCSKISKVTNTEEKFEFVATLDCKR